MKFEVELNAEDLTGALSNMAKREARKIIKEELRNGIQYELRHGDFYELIRDYIEKHVVSAIDNEIYWRIRSVKDVEFKDLTEKEKDCIARGAALAHSFDMEDLLGSDEVVDRLIEGAKDSLYFWARNNPTLQGKFIKALRENDRGGREDGQE